MLPVSTRRCGNTGYWAYWKHAVAAFECTWHQLRLPLHQTVLQRTLLVHTIFAVSLLSMAVVGILTLSEIARYLSIEIHDHMVVDPSFGQKLKIDFNVSFHALNCKREVPMLPRGSPACE